jgi:hypothetical protein
LILVFGLEQGRCANLENRRFVHPTHDVKKMEMEGKSVLHKAFGSELNVEIPNLEVIEWESEPSQRSEECDAPYEQQELRLRNKPVLLVRRQTYFSQRGYGLLGEGCYTWYQE